MLPMRYSPISGARRNSPTARAIRVMSGTVGACRGRRIGRKTGPGVTLVGHGYQRDKTTSPKQDHQPDRATVGGRMYSSDSGPVGRLAAFGNQLVEVHLWLREELDRLVGGESGGGDLRAHCLAFCSALERHHVGEDTHAFPAVEEDFPELGPTLELLRRDHEMIAGILARLAAMAGRPDEEQPGAERPDAERSDAERSDAERSDAERSDAERSDAERPDAERSDAERLAGEVAGLAAIVASHFAYEERTIVEALNRLDIPQWREDPPEFLRLYG